MSDNSFSILSPISLSNSNKSKVIRISTPVGATPPLAPVDSARVKLKKLNNPSSSLTRPETSSLNHLRRDRKLTKEESQTNIQLEEVRIQIEQLHSLRGHIFQVTDIVSQIIQTNFSAIVAETNLNIETNSMYNVFKSFFSCASKYFGGLQEIMKQKVEDRKNNSLPISELKAIAFSFCDKWKEVVDIYRIVEENGLPSLSSYINIRFKSIHHTIIDITSNNRRDTVHAETLLECGGKLRHLIYGLNHALQTMFLHTSLHNLDPSLMNTHINDIKAFLQIYNDAHFRDFPKSGCNSVDLSQYKSSVISCFNDIIKGIRVAFGLKDQMENLFKEVKEVQNHLNMIVETLNLPQTIIRTAVKAQPKHREVEEIDPLEKIKRFVGGSDVSIVVCAKIEDFIDNIQLKLALPFDNPNLNVWDRLKNLQETLFRKIETVQETEKDIKLLKQNLTAQGNEMAIMIKDAQEKNEKNAQIQRALNQRLKELHVQFENAEKARIEALETIKEKDQIIRKIRDEKNDIQNQDVLERVGKKMGELMTTNEDDFGLRNNDEIQSVDKMSVFVVERRCQKCREFEEMRRKTKEMLRDIIDIKEGETIVSVISKLKNEVTEIRDKNEKLEKENEKLDDELNIIKNSALKVLQKSKLFADLSFEGRSAEEISQLIINALEDIENQHRNQMKAREEELNYIHEDDLREISKELCGIVADSECQEMSDLKKLVHEKVGLVKTRYKNLKKDLKSRNKLLDRVEQWMNKMSELSTKDVPKEDAIDMLMTVIENKPNPLDEPLKKATKELNTIGSELYLLSNRVDDYNNQKTPNLPTGDPFKVLNYLSINFDTFINNVNKAKADNAQITHENKMAENSLRAICKTSARLLSIDDVDFEPMTITQLAFQAHSYTDAIASPEGNKHFISLADLNKLTKKMRKHANIISIDPLHYIPLLTQRFLRYKCSFNEIDKFEIPLATIFHNFDFKKSSFDQKSPDFGILREQVFQLHGLIGKMPETEMMQSLVHVFKYFVTMCSSFLSCIASAAIATEDSSFCFKSGI